MSTAQERADRIEQDYEPDLPDEPSPNPEHLYFVPVGPTGEEWECYPCDCGIAQDHDEIGTFI